MPKTRKSNMGLIMSGYQPRRSDDIIKYGMLKKKRVCKKFHMGNNRFFVLRKESGQNSPARLEYYENERQFIENLPPRKIYTIEDGFKFSLKADPRCYAMVIYFSGEVISLIASSESDREEWLKAFQSLRPTNFSYAETVWIVDVQEKNLGQGELVGPHYVRLNNDSLTLVKITNNAKTEFQLEVIRKSQPICEFFVLELGRLAVTGSGSLYMKTDDRLIAENMHNILNKLCSSKAVEGKSRAQLKEEPRDKNTLEKSQSGYFHDTAGNGTDSRHHGDSVSRVIPSFGTAAKNISLPLNSHDGRKRSAEVMRDIPKTYLSGTQSAYVDMEGRSPFDLRSSGSLGGDDSSLHASVRYSPDGETQAFSDDAHNQYVPMETSVSLKSSHSLCSMSTSPCTHPYPIPTSHLPQDIVSPSSSHSGCHSRSSSLVNETDDYLPMGRSSESSSQPVSCHAPSSGGKGFHTSGFSETPKSPPVPISRSSQENVEEYMEMPPFHGLSISPIVSQSKPVSDSPSDGDSATGFSPNGSCSAPSGTPSDDRLNEEFSDEDISLGRPVRTSSLGSKNEYISRKLRLDVVGGNVPETSRVRAYSVGSKVALHVPPGRVAMPPAANACTPLQETAIPNSSELPQFSQLKGSQTKSKSTSAPALESCPASSSWSGVGSCLNEFHTDRSQRFMELDFRPKSSDVLSGSEKKDRKASRMRTLGYHKPKQITLGGIRIPSFELKRDKKNSESEVFGRGFDIPGGHQDYVMLDFKRSPRSNMTGSVEECLAVKGGSSGYLDMGPPFRYSRYRDPLLNSSSSLSSSGSRDGYVEMTQGKEAFPSASSSSVSSSHASLSPPKHSTLAQTTASIANRVRKISTTLSPLSSMEHSARDDPLVDLSLDLSFKEGDKQRKKSKRKSFRDKKKSDPGLPFNFKQSSGEDISESSKSKSGVVRSAFSSILSRKTSHGAPPKASLSPVGSPPKSSRSTPSPFSSLTRSRSKGSKEIMSPGEPCQHSADVGLESNTSSIIPTVPNTSTTTPVTSVQEKLNRFSGSFSYSVLLEAPSGGGGGGGLSTSSVRPVQQASPVAQPPESSPYLNMAPAGKCLSSPEEKSEYVNMDRSSTSTSTVLPAGGEAPRQPEPVAKPSATPAASAAAVPSFHATGVPSPVAASHPPPQSVHSPPLSSPSGSGLSLKAADSTAVLGERCRSHSGPGAPQGRSLEKTFKQLSEPLPSIEAAAQACRAASACSSPVSFSPPTSPTRGSMSSLSEGGLSSASSTCTVVNLGRPSGPALQKPPSAQGQTCPEDPCKSEPLSQPQAGPRLSDSARAEAAESAFVTHNIRCAQNGEEADGASAPSQGRGGTCKPDCTRSEQVSQSLCKNPPVT